MREIRILTLVLGMGLSTACHATAQGHEGFENQCDSLRNAAPPDLVQFLNGVVPDEKNGDCVTWAIKKLGNERHEPAIAALVRLLDFRRPPTQREKQGIYLRMQIIEEIYPAANALELIGKKALPALLGAMKADSSSATARENAVAAWMEIYRSGDEHAKGVALLKQEEAKAKDEKVKQRLNWAAQKAVTWCNPPEESACKRAVALGTP